MGTLRLVAGVEALNGLILITWSASFAFLVMQRRWRFRGVFSGTTTKSVEEGYVLAAVIPLSGLSLFIIALPVWRWDPRWGFPGITICSSVPMGNIPMVCALAG